RRQNLLYKNIINHLYQISNYVVNMQKALIVYGTKTGTAAVTAYAGIVAWAGLIVPHIARIVFGAETRSTVPASIVLGSMFMAVCDTLARSLFPIELPLGIVTALAGAASFTVLLVFIPIKVERG
ncbi:MAG TPA: iron chelate uptake ABC transporter family permease subunit, partial [Spirochaetia bacterium]|nr:iron chelate uptake ABC transporter family permease subunit [Spirochaetia bacterium]